MSAVGFRTSGNGSITIEGGSLTVSNSSDGPAYLLVIGPGGRLFGSGDYEVNGKRLVLPEIGPYYVTADGFVHEGEPPSTSPCSGDWFTAAAYLGAIGLAIYFLLKY